MMAVLKKNLWRKKGRMLEEYALKELSWGIF